MIKDGQFYIDFPEPYKRRELNAKYRKIPLKDTTSRQLRKYFNAMAEFASSDEQVKLTIFAERQQSAAVEFDEEDPDAWKTQLT